MQGVEVESTRNGLVIPIRSRDNVGDVAVLRAGRCGVRILRQTRFLPPQKITTGPASYSLGAGGSFPSGKAAGA